MKNKEPKVKLIDLAPGRLFEYEGVIALKLERVGPLVSAFVVGTGIRFWPEGINDKSMNVLMVQPLSDHYIRYPFQESVLSQNWSEHHKAMEETSATGRAVDEEARMRFIRDQANHPNNRPLIVHEGPDIEGKTLTEMKDSGAIDKHLKFHEVTDPVIKFLNDNYHPHVTLIITNDRAELLEGLMAVKNDDHIKD